MLPNWTLKDIQTSKDDTYQRRFKGSQGFVKPPRIGDIQKTDELDITHLFIMSHAETIRIHHVWVRRMNATTILLVIHPTWLCPTIRIFDHETILTLMTQQQEYLWNPTSYSANTHEWQRYPDDRDSYPPFHGYPHDPAFLDYRISCSSHHHNIFPHQHTAIISRCPMLKTDSVLLDLLIVPAPTPCRRPPVASEPQALPQAIPTSWIPSDLSAIPAQQIHSFLQAVTTACLPQPTNSVTTFVPLALTAATSSLVD